ncbi:MAG TPA: carbohydrate ABC transporter permease [Magnetospirillaceae bacterium]
MRWGRWNFTSAGLTAFALAAAVCWFFPIYWAIITTLKHEYDTVKPGFQPIPLDPTLDAYSFVIDHTKIAYWYLNSIVTSLAITILVIAMSAACAYAISQLKFPGRRILYGLVLASFMVPLTSLIITHFILMNDFGLINTWAGIVLPQLIAPVTVIVYKQFFDGIPKEYREAAVIDGADEFRLFAKVYMPMSWGVTTALAIVTFIGAWDNFFWPFLAQTSDTMMTVTVGVTQVHEAFGVQYARNLAVAVMAAAPVVVAYLVFQRRVTDAIAISAGIKG